MFYQFHLLPVRETCYPGWYKSGTFPPLMEVRRKRYQYAPAPMPDSQVVNIRLSDLLKPGSHHHRFWVTTIPKKIRYPLIREPGFDGQVMGWGIRINECLNWAFILFLLLVLLLVVGAIVTVYAIITTDKSSAFGLGSFLVAIITVYATHQHFSWRAS